jgi:hypothetical protein
MCIIEKPFSSHDFWKERNFVTERCFSKKSCLVENCKLWNIKHIFVLYKFNHSFKCYRKVNTVFFLCQRYACISIKLFFLAVLTLQLYKMSHVAHYYILFLWYKAIFKRRYKTYVAGKIYTVLKHNVPYA